MSPIDLSSPYRSAPTARQFWRWLVEFVWQIEHSFERSRAKDRPVDDARLRIFLLLALFGLAFATVAVEAGRVALFAKPKAVFAGPDVSTARATLEDRNGLLLASDLPRFDAYLDPRDVLPSHRAETRDALVSVLSGAARPRIDEAFKSDRRTLIVAGLDQGEKALLHDLGRPGIEFDPVPERVYPLGTSAAHLIGYVEKKGGGIAGAERALDPLIRANGAAGQPVQLAMDLRVQAALEDELGRAVSHFQALGGAAIVVDVQTGEILGLASAPTFDVSKPLVIGNNRPIHDFDKGDTTLTLPQVFTHSSNIGASKVAMATGAARMDLYMRAFGIYAAAPSELNESTRPLTPKRDAGGRLDESTLAYMSFGQGLSVTPLQIATGMSAIFNGGTYRPLTILKRNGDEPVGRRVISAKTAQTMLDLMRLNVIDPKGSGRKAEVAGLNVGGKTGTAQKASGGHYMENARVASFAAVFPTTGALTDKRYLIYVLLDEPHPAADTFGFATAGFTAAPMAGAVINRIAPFLHVKRTAVTAPVPAAVPAAMGAD